ncbi:MAG: ligase-associated DNA damage response exonuclease [Anaerolineae bacterium]|nr:ligase-associated DNA damage response exonuclease [Anaerolineae bacterium]
MSLTDSGLYCSAGDFYIDPWKPVDRAVVTHAHSDHFAYGCKVYLVARPGENIFRKRLGDAAIKPLDYGETLTRNGIQISLHPAGHILGSAQVRIEHQGHVLVISGDYKIEPDKTSTPFELLHCHEFITEATFGLPIYRWQPQQIVFDQINQWWRSNAADGKASLIYCYALGKAQRLIAGVDASIGPIYTHGAVESLNAVYRAAGVDLPPTTYATTAQKRDFRGALIVAPLSMRGSSWTQRFGEHASAFASGWMRIRGTRRRRAMDRGFVLSDHIDWDGLMHTVRATGAARIGVTHGYIPVVVRWLREQGMDAYGIATRYSDEGEDAGEIAGESEGETT